MLTDKDKLAILLAESGVMPAACAQELNIGHDLATIVLHAIVNMTVDLEPLEAMTRAALIVAEAEIAEEEV